MLTFSRHALTTILLAVLLCAPAPPALAILGLFEGQPASEQERLETLERIQDVQEKLQRLQEKLQALERRKATAAQGDDASDPATVAGPANWQPLDETVSNPGQFGVYTYLLFHGNLEDTAAVGVLEDLILTIETLPTTTVADRLGNRFLVPVEQPQSSIELGRQPYDFKLSAAYLQRFGLDLAHKGPVLVSSTKPIDPYGPEVTADFLVVNPGRLNPEATRALLVHWHQYERSLTPSGGHALAGIFADLLDGAGPTLVERSGNRLRIDFHR